MKIKSLNKNGQGSHQGLLDIITMDRCCLNVTILAWSTLVHILIKSISCLHKADVPNLVTYFY